MAIKRIHRINNEDIEKIISVEDGKKYASEHNITPLELQYAIHFAKAKGTPCEDCEYIGMTGWNPCSCCSRGIKDRYKEMDFGKIEFVDIE